MNRCYSIDTTHSSPTIIGLNFINHNRWKCALFPRFIHELNLGFQILARCFLLLFLFSLFSLSLSLSLSSKFQIPIVFRFALCSVCFFARIDPVPEFLVASFCSFSGPIIPISAARVDGLQQRRYRGRHSSNITWLFIGKALTPLTPPPPPHLPSLKLLSSPTPSLYSTTSRLPPFIDFDCVQHSFLGSFFKVLWLLLLLLLLLFYWCWYFLFGSCMILIDCWR